MVNFLNIDHVKIRMINDWFLSDLPYNILQSARPLK